MDLLMIELENEKSQENGKYNLILLITETIARSLYVYQTRPQAV